MTVIYALIGAGIFGCLVFFAVSLSKFMALQHEHLRPGDIVLREEDLMIAPNVTIPIEWEGAKLDHEVCLN